MTPTAYILGVASALLVFAYVMELLRRRRLRERHAVWWVIASTLALIAGLFPSLLAGAASFVGVQLPSNLVSFVGIAVLVLVSIQHASELTELESETRVLAEKSALLELRISELEKAQATGEKDD